MSENYCADIVCRHDYPRYVMILCAPRARRAVLFALYALHYELSKIPSVIHEPMMGLIRFQWWRDAVKSAFTDKPAPHNIIRSVHQVALTWQEEDLLNLVDAHERLFEQKDKTADSILHLADALGNAHDKAWSLQEKTDAKILAAYIVLEDKLSANHMDSIQQWRNDALLQTRSSRLMAVIVDETLKKKVKDLHNPLLPLKLWLRR